MRRLPRERGVPVETRGLTDVVTIISTQRDKGVKLRRDEKTRQVPVLL